MADGASSSGGAQNGGMWANSLKADDYQVNRPQFPTCSVSHKDFSVSVVGFGT
ncbi:Arginyl-tRNA--protein transferase 1 [Zea mays]|uniref:Arginyl-tRNA--protein transferase 1 n=1 Tax=Zea mays TaxID=4577 RepID=A0A1D6FPB0_MAIZE|nr:Arginyl-tRNA--protein transferase 1 [Zea mays]